MPISHLQVDKFKIYSEYCTNYEMAVACLQELTTSSKDMDQFLRTCQQDLEHALPLSSQLIKPVQRIMRYHIMLKVLTSLACPATLSNQPKGSHHAQGTNLSSIPCHFIEDHHIMLKVLTSLACPATLSNQPRGSPHHAQGINLSSMPCHSASHLIKPAQRVTVYSLNMNVYGVACRQTPYSILSPCVISFTVFSIHRSVITKV